MPAHSAHAEKLVQSEQNEQVKLKLTPTEKNSKGRLPVKKYYNNANENAAFIRCVDVLTQLMQKYGAQVLDTKTEKTESNDENDAA